MLVRLVKKWRNIDLATHSPTGTWQWGSVRFTDEPVEQCDFLFVFTEPTEVVHATCPASRVWLFVEEPPVRYWRYLKHNFPQFARVYGCDHHASCGHYVPGHPVLPWHVDRSHAQLIDMAPPKKSRALSWITSNEMLWPGQCKRMQFLNNIAGRVPFDLYGKGFKTISSKWQGIASYRYSLAIENYAGPDYWTEKLADCFLAWTMPIYFGCTNITDYFPDEAMIRIDIDDPDAAHIINDAIKSNLWQKHRDAIGHARDLVLNQYQPFPTMTRLVEADVAQRGELASDNVVIQPNRAQRIPGPSTARYYWRRLRERLGCLPTFDHSGNLAEHLS